MKLPNLPLAEHTVCKPGDRYLVRCLFIAPANRGTYIPRGGWVPVLGPKHQDAEHLEFPWHHFHIDWRFMDQATFDRAGQWSTVHAKVVTSSTGYLKIDNEPELKVRTCRRAMPTFPDLPKSYSDVKRRWQNMERAQAFTCNKLKPGGICPHRGIDLTPFAQPDGTAICPGHGLRWNLATGELMPRFAA